MAARPRGADSKTGHQAGGGSCRTGASQKGPFRSGRLRKRANGGLPVAPQSNKPVALPLPQQRRPSLSRSVFQANLCLARTLGPRDGGSQDSHIAHRSCSVSLLSAMNARRNDASHEGGEAQSSAWWVQALLGRDRHLPVTSSGGTKGVRGGKARLGV